MFKIAGVVFSRPGTLSHWSQKFFCSTAVKTKIVDEVHDEMTPPWKPSAHTQPTDNNTAFSNRRVTGMKVITSFDQNNSNSASADYDPMIKLLEATKKVNEFDKQNPYKSHSAKFESQRPFVTGANSIRIGRSR